MHKTTNKNSACPRQHEQTHKPRQDNDKETKPIQQTTIQTPHNTQIKQTKITNKCNERKHQRQTNNTQQTAKQATQTRSKLKNST